MGSSPKLSQHNLFNFFFTGIALDGVQVYSTRADPTIKQALQDFITEKVLTIVLSTSKFLSYIWFNNPMCFITNEYVIPKHIPDGRIVSKSLLSIWKFPFICFWLIPPPPTLLEFPIPSWGRGEGGFGTTQSTIKISSEDIFWFCVGY